MTIKFKLTIAYDGTGYEGWQVQKTGTGVQEKVEAVLAKFFPSQPRLHSSSRTDTGVHALGMVAHFVAARAECKLTGRRLVLALNSQLPADVRVMSVVRASEDFHARFQASGKQYRYFVWNHVAMNPLLRTTAWHVPRPLDLQAMRVAAPLLVGRHDFQSFSARCNVALFPQRPPHPGSPSQSGEAGLGGEGLKNLGYAKAGTVRSLTRCDLKKSGPLLTFTLEGGGFLYKMCRGIVGTLVQIGQGKFPPEQITSMLAQRDRRVAGMTAPAQGLVLWKVFYAKRR